MNRPLHHEAVAAEEARIQTAYAKRKQKGVYAGLYSWFNSGQVFISQDRERRILNLLKQYGFTDLKSKKLLEVGCGTGYWLREFIKWGALPENMSGVDLLEERIAEARRLCPPKVKLECGSAAKLAFPSETFDLVLQSTVFTSILDSSLRQQVAGEMMRVVKREGLILWYDFQVNNPNNPDVQGVKRRQIQSLFLGCRISLERITLAPPLARLVAPYSYLACYLLGKFPLLCTHYMGVIRKP